MFISLSGMRAWSVLDVDDAGGGAERNDALKDIRLLVPLLVLHVNDNVVEEHHLQVARESRSSMISYPDVSRSAYLQR
jgi:hypothetical protein